MGGKSAGSFWVMEEISYQDVRPLEIDYSGRDLAAEVQRLRVTIHVLCWAVSIWGIASIGIGLWVGDWTAWHLFRALGGLVLWPTGALLQTLLWIRERQQWYAGQMRAPPTQATPTMLF